jgi:hypothetical protein
MLYAALHDAIPACDTITGMEAVACLKHAYQVPGSSRIADRIDPNTGRPGAAAACRLFCATQSSSMPMCSPQSRMSAQNATQAAAAACMQAVAEHNKAAHVLTSEPYVGITYMPGCCLNANC